VNSLVILYNPYYNAEVIEDHVRILNEASDVTQAKVGFGKVRSKRRDYEHPYEDRVDTLCDAIAPDNPLQLFLTDFSSVYVCYVERIVRELGDVKAPKYYVDLDVDRWFVVSDIRELARDDFGFVRDRFLSNLTTPNYGGHTFTLYGNRYDYPLMVRMKDRIDYFEGFTEGERHFTRVFKGSQYAQTQRDLIHFVFGKELFYRLHPDSAESLIAAEIDYREHMEDATHDFSAVAIHYGKVFENESYRFLKALFDRLLEHNPSLENVQYEVQGRRYRLRDYLTQKPNMGTNKFLLGNPEIFNAYKTLYSDMRRYASLLGLLKFQFRQAADSITPVRNEASHGGVISLGECKQVRATLLGVGRTGILSSLLAERDAI
jgi:hypothetical protein